MQVRKVKIISILRRVLFLKLRVFEIQMSLFIGLGTPITQRQFSRKSYFNLSRVN